MNWNQFWLTDERFVKIQSHLPVSTHGKASVDDGRVISGIAQVLKSGDRRIDAPTEHGPRNDALPPLCLLG